jgi:hypothetical protein
MTARYTTQNGLIMNNLLEYYNASSNMCNVVKILNGSSKISLRVVDWFVTNFAKHHCTMYMNDGSRFKVYDDYKLRLKSYSKRRFDPFCRFDRIEIPYEIANEGTDDASSPTTTSGTIETTIGQLNFFRWAFENGIIRHIEDNYSLIIADMNSRNSTAKKKVVPVGANKTRRKRQELSVLATKSIKKEEVEITVSFS